MSSREHSPVKIMIVNLPTWTNIVNSSESWVSGTLNTFLPAGYFEIGIAVGVGLILFVAAIVSGGLNALLGSFGRHSDPMAGIPSGNSGMGYSGGNRFSRFGGIGRMGGVGNVSTRVGTFGIYPSRRLSDKEAVAQSVRRREMLRQEYDKRDRARFNQSQDNRRKALARES